jgi:hypothetical protein
MMKFKLLCTPEDCLHKIEFVVVHKVVRQVLRPILEILVWSCGLFKPGNKMLILQEYDPSKTVGKFVVPVDIAFGLSYENEADKNDKSCETVANRTEESPAP